MKLKDTLSDNDKKYIAFRTFKNIEKILVKAQELRNKMNKK